MSQFNPPLLPELSDTGPQTHAGLVRKYAAQMEETFSNGLRMMIHEFRLCDDFEAASSPDEAEKPVMS